MIDNYTVFDTDWNKHTHNKHKITITRMNESI
ncbi:MAG: hypothetical protein ACI8RD_007766 [Bacillariaceae sp.]|jgi:hypothetical protein